MLERCKQYYIVTAPQATLSLKESAAPTVVALPPEAAGAAAETPIATALADQASNSSI